jgi:threonine/homoserine/homoserine lactone efflux protein
MDATTAWLFLTAAVLLVVIPGPGVLYVVARSVDQGRRAGLVSVLGVGIGNFIQVLLAALGLSALIASSALAFDVIRIAGGLYLIWLGINRLRTPAEFAAQLNEPTPHRRILSQGIVVAALNPKTALFFVAFLPQFVDPAGGSVALQILLLGTVFVALALIGDSLYAVTAGAIAARLSTGNTAAMARGSRYGAAAIYFGLGALALFGTRRPT